MFYFIPLLSFPFRLGEKKVSSIQQLNNGNRWHQVHITRNKQSVKMNIKNADGDSMSLTFFLKKNLIYQLTGRRIEANNLYEKYRSY